jgi:hypothetical protein
MEQVSASASSNSAIPVLSPVKQFSQRYPAFTEAAMRAIVFNADDRPSTQGTIPGNGFAPAIVRLGRRVLIDEAKFFDIIRAKQSQGGR